MTGRVRALLGIDMQPTFCEGGELPVEGGNDVCERGAAFTREHGHEYAVVAFSQDWHVDPGDHFSDSPDFVDTWPPHGVVGTAGAELHPALRSVRADVAVRKGAHAAAYSAFEGVDSHGRGLAEVLRAAGVTDVDAMGIAESHCVRSTVLDALGEGFAVRVLSDLTVPVTPELGEAARAEMAAAGATSVLSGQAFPSA